MKVTNFRNEGTESEQWFCPNCNRWTTPWHYSISNGRAETNCNHCGEMLESKTVKEVKEEAERYEQDKLDMEERKRKEQAYDRWATSRY